MGLINLLIPALLAAHGAHAHSFINSFVIGGARYSGFCPTNHDTDPTANPPVLAAWSTEVIDDGWVGEQDYHTPDIVCHVNASNANGIAPIEAGDFLTFQWNGWPESHHGPIITYMAYCGPDAGSCMAAEKTELEFFAVDAVGLIDPSASLHEYYSAFGIWATDVLIHTNHTYTVQIPPSLAPGNYAIRHEIIALHYALLDGLGPQHYPQCIDVMVLGSGTAMPAGVPATELYRGDEAGLRYDISQDPLPPYTIPAPALMEGAMPSAVQEGAVVTALEEAIPAVVTAEAAAA